MSFLGELSRRNIIRVGLAYMGAAWLIVQVSDTLFPMFGFGQSPARVVAIVLFVGFIPTLIVAWVFRIKLGRLERKTSIDLDVTVPPQIQRRWDMTIMLVLAAAIGYFTFDKFLIRDRTNQTQPETVGVVKRPQFDEDYISRGDNNQISNRRSELTEQAIVNPSTGKLDPNYYRGGTFKSYTHPNKYVGLGLIVTSVVPGSDFDEAGLLVGDVVYHREDVKLGFIDSVEKLKAMIIKRRRSNPNNPLAPYHFSIRRGDKSFSVMLRPIGPIP